MISMALVNRRVTYKLYPSASEDALMDKAHDLHRLLYNSSLRERCDAWRLNKKSISFADQCQSLTEIRRSELDDDIEFRALNAQSLQVTLKRLDRAFESFFRRVKAGQTPGFPRFKSKRRFSGFGYKTHGDGFRFTPGPNWRNGTLRLSGIGTMMARGEARTPGKVVSADIMRKADGWFLSLVVACEPHRERTGDAVAGLDWGVTTYATLCTGPMEFSDIENDRLWQQEQEGIKEKQREFSAALRGKRSKRATRARRLIAKRYRKLANKRKDRAHKLAAKLAAQHALIVTEQLTVKNMTASAAGTVEEPGKNVRQKAGLNREILDTAPSSFLSLLTTKAEEAGGKVILVDTRKYKPSQTCPVSGKVHKKRLDERSHTLPDGQVIGRDQAAAWVLHNIGLNLRRQDALHSAGDRREPAEL